MNLSSILPSVNKEYSFHIYYSTPHEHGLKLDTNAGNKRLSSWEKSDDLTWSFLWREELVKRELRQVDRFIRTRDGAPYFYEEEIAYVIQDQLEGDKLPLQEEKSWSLLGQGSGLLFQAFQAASAQLNMESMRHRQQRYMQQEQGEKDKLQKLKNEVFKGPDTMFKYLAQDHWKSIEKRWKQSITIKLGGTPIEGKGEKKKIFLALPHLGVEQWLRHKSGVIFFYSNDKKGVPDYRGLAELLQQLYLHQDSSFEKLDLFFEAFDQTFAPPIETYYNVLSFLIQPKPFIKVLEKFLFQGYSDEESIQQWLDLCEQQDQLDQLNLWFAAHVDRKREDAVTLC